MIKTNGINKYQLNGKIKINNLLIGELLEKIDETKLENPKPNQSGNRTKRSEIITIRNSKIQIQTINGINWDSFIASLYRKGVNTIINGNLILTNSVNTQSIVTTKINDILMENLLTVATDQHISANYFSNSSLCLKDLEVGIFNDINNFADNVALMDENNEFKSK